MEKLDARYIVGLVDGEGSFHINIRRWPKNKNGYSVSAEFSMDLLDEDVEILRSLQQTLECGTVIPKRQRKDKWRLQARYHVTNLKDINEIIVPFFKENPPQFPTKKTDFEVWCQILELMNAGKHLTNEGLEKVLELREQFTYRLPKVRPP